MNFSNTILISGETGRHVIGRKNPSSRGTGRLKRYFKGISLDVTRRDVLATFLATYSKIGDFVGRKIFSLKGLFIEENVDVLKVGLEPTQSFPHMPLKHACLPVPPLQQYLFRIFFCFRIGRYSIYWQ